MLAPPTGEFRGADPGPACSTPQPVPDLIVVSGVMARSPVGDVFVRYGNTVTHASGMVMVFPPADVQAMVRKALGPR